MISVGYLRKRSAICVLFMALACSLCAFAAPAPIEGYRVVATSPHSTANYTEGFFYLDGLFYEGTGIVGQFFGIGN